MAMILTVIGILALVAIIAVIINGVESYHQNSVPFIAFNSVEYPLVSFTCDNRELTFLVDSGSNMSYLQKSILEEVNHRDAGFTMEVCGIDNIKETVEFFDVNLNINKRGFINTFGAKDIDFGTVETNSGENIKICGILGSLFLAKYGAKIDYFDEKLVFEE